MEIPCNFRTRYSAQRQISQFSAFNVVFIIEFLAFTYRNLSRVYTHLYINGLHINLYINFYI